MNGVKLVSHPQHQQNNERFNAIKEHCNNVEFDAEQEFRHVLHVFTDIFAKELLSQKAIGSYSKYTIKLEPSLVLPMRGLY